MTKIPNLNDTNSNFSKALEKDVKKPQCMSVQKPFCLIVCSVPKVGESYLISFLSMT